MQLNALAMATSALLAFGNVPLYAQSWQMPPDNQRCPSKWGAADQRGSANMHILELTGAARTIANFP